jgi:hypothetical protein
MTNNNRPELLASMLDELERFTLTLALAEDWSVSVENAGVVVPLVRRRPDRHLVITLSKDPSCDQWSQT